jgi:5-methylcytosine-specific restriction endonuclease McrA
MNSYSELLRDPRWQRKRLEVMERAHFACEECRSETRTLNVHHRFYEKGRAPWDYPDRALVCLCELCHRTAESELAAIRRLAGMTSAAARAEILRRIVALVDVPRPPSIPAAPPRVQRGRWKCFNAGAQP